MTRNIKDMLAKSVRSVLDGEPKKLKRRKKTTIKDVEIIFKPTQSKVRVVDLSEMRSSRFKDKQDIREWTNRDFATHFLKAYRIHCEPEFTCNVTSIVTYMNRVHDAIMQSLGFCDNIVLRDYLDFAVKKWIKSLRAQSNSFYIGWLRDDRIVTDFVSSYKYEERVEEYIESKPDTDGVYPEMDIFEEVPSVISGGDIEESFLLGVDRIVMDYGVLGPLNWLVMKKSWDVGRAVSAIAKSVSKLKGKKGLKRIFELTRKYNPYPVWFVIKSCDRILNILATEYKVKVPGLYVTFEKGRETWDF